MKDIWKIHKLTISMTVLCLGLLGLYALLQNDATTQQENVITETNEQPASATSSFGGPVGSQPLTADTEEEEVPVVVPEQPIIATDEVQAVEEVIDVETGTVPVQVKESATYEITPGMQADIVTAHNQVRNQKGLAALTWSPAVAASAQDWADNLASRGCVLEHSDGRYGENLYYSWTTRDLVLQPKVAVSWWADEEQYYEYETNSCEPGEQCGHYTQMVWEDTTVVGCGVGVCIAEDRTTQLWVCQYNPAGNVGDDRPY